MPRADPCHAAPVGACARSNPAIINFLARGHIKELANAIAVFASFRQPEQPSDFGGQHIVIPPLAAQKRIQAGFGQAQAVQRGGIKKPHPLIPGAVQRGLRVIFGQSTIKIAHGGCTEPKFRKGDAASARAIPPPCLQLHIILPCG